MSQSVFSVKVVINDTENNIGPDKEIYEGKIVIIFLLINLNMCFGCSKEPSH